MGGLQWICHKVGVPGVQRAQRLTTEAAGVAAPPMEKVNGVWQVIGSGTQRTVRAARRIAAPAAVGGGAAGVSGRTADGTMLVCHQTGWTGYPLVPLPGGGGYANPGAFAPGAFVYVPGGPSIFGNTGFPGPVLVAGTPSEPGSPFTPHGPGEPTTPGTEVPGTPGTPGTPENPTPVPEPAAVALFAFALLALALARMLSPKRISA